MPEPFKRTGNQNKPEDTISFLNKSDDFIRQKRAANQLP